MLNFTPGVSYNSYLISPSVNTVIFSKCKFSISKTWNKVILDRDLNDFESFILFKVSKSSKMYYVNMLCSYPAYFSIICLEEIRVCKSGFRRFTDKIF